MAHLDDHLRSSLGDDDYQRLVALLDKVITAVPSWTPPSDD
jgi:hypothetical protein